MRQHEADRIGQHGQAHVEEPVAAGCDERQRPRYQAHCEQGAADWHAHGAEPEREQQHAIPCHRGEPHKANEGDKAEAAQDARVGAPVDFYQLAHVPIQSNANSSK